MHPAIIRAAAAERTKDLRVGVARGRRAAEIRRSRRAQRTQLTAGRGRLALRAPRAA